MVHFSVPLFLMTVMTPMIDRSTKMTTSLTNLSHVGFTRDTDLREFFMDELDEHLNFRRLVSFKIREDALWINKTTTTTVAGSDPTNRSMTTLTNSHPTYVFYEKLARISLLDLQDDASGIFEMSITDGDHHFYRCSSVSLKLEFFHLIRLSTQYYASRDESITEKMPLMGEVSYFQWLESIAFYEQRVYELFEELNQRMVHLEELVNNVKRLSNGYQSTKEYLESHGHIIETKNVQMVELKTRQAHLDRKIIQSNEMIQRMGEDSTSKEDHIEILRTNLMKFREASRLALYRKNAFKRKIGFVFKNLFHQFI